MGEKTGWTYITIPQKFAEKLKPGYKRSFRVKGSIDEYKIKSVALLPMGKGDFIMPVNAALRKGIMKRKGDTVKLSLEVDNSQLKISAKVTCIVGKTNVLLDSTDLGSVNSASNDAADEVPLDRSDVTE